MFGFGSSLSGWACQTFLLRTLGARDAEAYIARKSLDVASLLTRAVTTPGRLAGVRLLFSAGTEVDLLDDKGWTLLIHAAERGDTEIVQGLLASGAQANARTPRGSTALSLAVLRRHTGVVRSLLAAGADVNVRNGAGETPLMIASKFELVTQVRRPAVISMENVAAGADGYTLAQLSQPEGVTGLEGA